MKVRVLYVLLNKDTDKTLSHLPLDIHVVYECFLLCRYYSVIKNTYTHNMF